MAKRVVLAYSGGLDTSVAVRWMIDNLGVEVIALAVDVGQAAEDYEVVKERRPRRRGDRGGRGRRQGGVRRRVLARRPSPANALYEGRYPLVSALSRPVIVKHLVEAAKFHGADAVAHGCTGKGNDQVRFEVSTRALEPGPRGHRPGARVGDDPRGLHPLRVRPRHPDRRDEGEGVLDRRQPLGPGHRVRRDGGSVEHPAARACGSSPSRPPPSRWTSSSGSRPGVPVSVDGEALSVLEVDRRGSTTSSAATAGAGSTWSRTAASASRAGRPTSARRASR